MNKKIIMPFAVIGLGIVGAFGLVSSRSQVQTQTPEVPPPLIRAQLVTTQDLQLTVSAQGSVTPRTESTLISQVAGQIISVSPAFNSGGFFESGDILLTIDPRDYEVAVARARVQVAQAELRLAREEEESKIARQEWERLGKGQPTSLVLREPQLAEATASLESARALLEQAELNLERTKIRALFAGRVRTKNADVGQYVNPGVPLARIYAVDYVEVRLPIPDDQLGYLDLPFNFRGETEHALGPEVLLHATFAGNPYTWTGRIVRMEGEIDARSRMIHLVARVEDPYGKGEDPNRPPLAVGLFVQAEILGQTVRNIVILPRSALRGSDQILVVENGERLRFRTVDVLRADEERAIIASGLSTGEQICLSSLDAVVDGMRVRVLTESSESGVLTRTGGTQ